MIGDLVVTRVQGQHFIELRKKVVLPSDPEEQTDDNQLLVHGIFEDRMQLHGKAFASHRVLGKYVKVKLTDY